MRRPHAAWLVVALILLTALAHSRASSVVVVTGTVTEFQAGRLIAITNEQSGPKGFGISLRETTDYEGEPGAIRRGVRVTVSYRSVGERRPVADEVRVLTSSSGR